MNDQHEREPLDRRLAAHEAEHAEREALVRTLAVRLTARHGEVHG
jgi:hypothetical protein